MNEATETPGRRPAACRRASQRRMPRLSVLLALAFLAWAAIVAYTGGGRLSAAGWRVSFRDWTRPLILAALAGGFAWWRHGIAGVRDEMERLASMVIGWPRAVAAVLAAAVLASGLLLGARVAGSADAYGYLSQARLWREGRLHVSQPIATQVPWPDADWTFSPLGYRPSGTPGVIVPTYAPGLPMLMAFSSFALEDGEYWVVPMMGALAVLLAFALGRRLRGAGTGLFAAALLASSPAFLFFLMWPMSDVPAAAFWTASLVLLARKDSPWSWTAAGLAASVAILIRPNTVPVGAVLFLGFVHPVAPAFRARGRKRSRACDASEPPAQAACTDGSPVRASLARLRPLLYAAGVVPGCLAVAAINTSLYGSPLSSGYGHVSGLYELRNAGVNLERHVSWLLTSETPFILLALVPLLAWRGTGPSRSLALRMASYGIAVWLCYLFYRPFEEWWYLRFLLPAFPALLALTAAGFSSLMAKLPSRHRAAVALVIVTAVMVLRIGFAREEGAFGMYRGERRYVETAAFISKSLPADAVFICMQQSGSLRYYAARPTVRWDVLAPEWLDRSIASLESLGYTPFLVIEDLEEAVFRERFSRHGRLGRLDWKPYATLPTTPVVRIYDPRDARER